MFILILALDNLQNKQWQNLSHVLHAVRDLEAVEGRNERPTTKYWWVANIAMLLLNT